MWISGTGSFARKKIVCSCLFEIFLFIFLAKVEALQENEVLTELSVKYWANFFLCCSLLEFIVCTITLFFTNFLANS